LLCSQASYFDPIRSSNHPTFHLVRPRECPQRKRQFQRRLQRKRRHSPNQKILFPSEASTRDGFAAAAMARVNNDEEGDKCDELDDTPSLSPDRSPGTLNASDLIDALNAVFSSLQTSFERGFDRLSTQVRQSAADSFDQLAEYYLDDSSGHNPGLSGAPRAEPGTSGTSSSFLPGPTANNVTLPMALGRPICYRIHCVQ
jgi:hypothetical protein